MKKQIISAICAVGMLATVSAGFTTVSAETPTSYILTNNIESTTDKSLYSGMSAMDIGLTYSYVGDEIYTTKKDPNLNCLTKANIQSTTSGSHVVWGPETTSENSVDVIAGMKTNTCITGVDFYRLEVPGKLGSVSVSVSSNGTTYSTPVTVTSAEPIKRDGTGDEVTSGDRKIYKYAVNFSIPVTGRYVKITSFGTQQQALCEMVIKGSSEEFSFGGTKFDSTTKKFSGFLVNDPYSDTVASKVITAVYDNTGRFVAARTADVSVAANASQAYSADFSGVTISSGYLIKSFAWTDINNKIMPLASMTTYTVE